MKRIAIVLLISFIFFRPNVFSQRHRPDHLSIAITTLHTGFPFGSFSNLFIKEFHPGIEAGTGFNWKTKAKHDWFQEFKLGYSYQRFVQHSISLYSEFGYRYKFFKSFYGEAAIGAGYLQAISAEKVFKLQGDGTYKKRSNIGRPQAMAAFSINVGKKIMQNGLIVFLDYQQRLQFPFIKSYVPFLPTNMLIVGIQFPIKTK